MRGFAYDDQRRVIEAVPTVDVDTGRYKLLATSQIASPASLDKLVELGAEVQRVLLLQDTALDHLPLISELHLELVFAKHHGGWRMRTCVHTTYERVRVRMGCNIYINNKTRRSTCHAYAFMDVNKSRKRRLHCSRPSVSKVLY